jgi:carbamoyl-phosphate synthase small subunit
MSGEPAWLVLADGARFSGLAFGAPGIATGEAVFTTGMTGYQEILTDPSYTGQIVTMTAPQIGNTGCNAEDLESVGEHPHAAGLVVRDASALASSWRARESLDAYLARHGVVAIGDVDTRSLVKHIRDRGAQNAALGVADPERLLAAARAAPSMEGLDLVERVTPKEPYAWAESTGIWRASGTPGVPGTRERAPARDRHVVVMDLGIKRNILRCLVDVGCRVTAVPATTGAEAILDLARRHLRLERPGRSGRGRLRRRHAEGPVGKAAHLRHLPRPPAARPRAARAPTSSSSATAA